MKTITAMAAVTALITLSFLTLAGSNSYADSPGVIVGTTYYEYQNNGASGNRIVVDSQNGEHFCWMNGIGTWSGNRWVYYNFMDENGVLAFSEGTPVSVDQGAG